MEDLLKNIKKRLRPEEKEHALIKRIEDATDHDVRLGGSYAKKTHLKDDYDIDIYVQFDGPPYTERLRNILDSANITYKEIQGSRNYFIVNQDVEYEIVPVKKITKPEHAETVIDLSTFHIEYFNKKADKNPSLRDEVRLLKKFMKANRLYGSESHIKGFSGHVVDLLIIHYGSFKKTLQAVKNWGEETVIDHENLQDHPKLSINSSKLQSPLIVVDPTDPYRNAAAALSKENYERFKNIAREFLERPSEEFFTKKPFEDIVKENSKGKTIMIEVRPLDGKEDIAACKIMKIKEYVTRQLTFNDFPIHWTGWEYGEPSRIAVSTDRIDEEKIREGPPLEMDKHVQKFKKKYDETFEKNETIFAKTSRSYTNPETLLNELITNDYVVERCKDIRVTKVL